MATPLIIIFLLSFPLCVSYVVSKYRNIEFNIGKYASFGLGAAFIFFFIGHFIKTDGMVEMLPPWIPYRIQIVYFTGILELFIGISLFIQKFQIKAAKFAIIIFVVFFPANIYSAINALGLGGHQMGPIYLLIRGPLQAILISWAYFLCIKYLEK